MRWHHNHDHMSHIHHTKLLIANNNLTLMCRISTRTTRRTDKRTDKKASVSIISKFGLTMDFGFHQTMSVVVLANHYIATRGIAAGLTLLPRNMVNLTYTWAYFLAIFHPISPSTSLSTPASLSLIASLWLISTFRCLCYLSIFPCLKIAKNACSMITSVNSIQLMIVPTLFPEPIKKTIRWMLCGGDVWG